TKPKSFRRDPALRNRAVMLALGPWEENKIQGPRQAYLCRLRGGYSVRFAAAAHEVSDTYTTHYHFDHLEGDGGLPGSPGRRVVIRLLDGQGRKIDFSEVRDVDRVAEASTRIPAFHLIDQRAFDRPLFTGTRCALAVVLRDLVR